MTVIDDGGPDDVPEQKDLSFMTVDYLGSTINVKWGWDDTATAVPTRVRAAPCSTPVGRHANYAFCITVDVERERVTTQSFRADNSLAQRCTNAVARPAADDVQRDRDDLPGSDPFKDIQPKEAERLHDGPELSYR